MNRGEAAAANTAKAEAVLVLSSTEEAAGYLVTYGEGHDPRSVRGSHFTEAQWIEAHPDEGELAAFRRSLAARR